MFLFFFNRPHRCNRFSQRSNTWHGDDQRKQIVTSFTASGLIKIKKLNATNKPCTYIYLSFCCSPKCFTFLHCPDSKNNKSTIRVRNMQNKKSIKNNNRLLPRRDWPRVQRGASPRFLSRGELVETQREKSQ